MERERGTANQSFGGLSGKLAQNDNRASTVKVQGPRGSQGDPGLWEAPIPHGEMPVSWLKVKGTCSSW